MTVDHKVILKPFAVNGNRAVVPENAHADGAVSWDSGYGANYERDLAADALAKPIERAGWNQIVYDLSSAIRAIQAGEFEEYNAALMTSLGGYSRGALVKSPDGSFWISTVDGNQTDPNSGGAGWVSYDQLTTAEATGTGDAILLTTPFTIKSYGKGMRLYVRAIAANTTAAPTINVDGLGTRVIKRSGGGNLIAGDISGAGHWLILFYDSALSCFILENPRGVSTSKMVISGSDINETATNGQASVTVNTGSYQGGNTQFRDFDVYDGKGNIVAKFRGSDKTLVMSGPITAPSATFSGGRVLVGTADNGADLFQVGGSVRAAGDFRTLSTAFASNYSAEGRGNDEAEVSYLVFSNRDNSAAARGQLTACGPTHPNYQGFRQNKVVLYSASGDLVLNADTNNNIEFWTKGQLQYELKDGRHLFGNFVSSASDDGSSIFQVSGNARISGSITAPAATINGAANVGTLTSSGAITAPAATFDKSGDDGWGSMLRVINTPSNDRILIGQYKAVNGDVSNGIFAGDINLTEYRDLYLNCIKDEVGGKSVIVNKLQSKGEITAPAATINGAINQTSIGKNSLSRGSSQSYAINVPAGNKWVCIGRFGYFCNATVKVIIGSQDHEETLTIKLAGTYYATFARLEVQHQSYNSRIRSVGVSSDADAQDKYLWINLHQAGFASSVGFYVDGVGFTSSPETVVDDGSQPTQRVSVSFADVYGTTDDSTRLSGKLYANGAIVAPAATINGRDVASGLSQVGEIKISPINAALPGTLICDGRAVSQTTYARLFAFIGGTFNTNAGPDEFNLPDYRGMFIRGLDSGRGVDVNRAISANPQADSLKAHKHNYFSSTMGITNSGTPHRGIFDDDAQNTTAHPTSETGGTETRPVNMAAVYCIVY